MGILREDLVEGDLRTATQRVGDQADTGDDTSPLEGPADTSTPGGALAEEFRRLRKRRAQKRS